MITRELIKSLRVFLLSRLFNFKDFEESEYPSLRKFFKYNPVFNKFYAPYYLGLSITSKCNLRCRMCYKDHTKEQNMCFEDFLHILKQFPYIIRLTLSGDGTNLLNPNYFKILDYLKKHKPNLYTTAYDNFTLMDNENAKKILDSNLKELIVSIDGVTKEVYERIRVGADFEKVLTNLKNFIDLKNKEKKQYPVICLHFTSSKENISELTHLPEFVASLGIKNLRFSTVVPGDRGSFNKEYIDKVRLDKDSYLKYAAEIVRESVKLGIQVTHIKMQDISRCTLPWMGLAIDPHGELYPSACSCFNYIKNNGKSPFGNIFKENFKIINNSKAVLEFRKCIREGRITEYCLRTGYCFG